MFELQPTLRGHRVYLRPLRVDELEEMYAVAKDPFIWEQHPIKNRYQFDVFEQFFTDGIKSGGAFAICAALDDASVPVKKDEIIGCTRYHDYNAEKNSIFIGYTFFARKCWGSKFNPEVKQLMLRHAFQYVEKVNFQVGEGNIRSQTAVLRLGARLVGIENTKPVHIIFELTKSEFERGTLAWKSFK
jgi:RimJ/RimL family protein N-acetyltransferase